MSQQGTAKAGHSAGPGGGIASEDSAAGSARESVAGISPPVEDSAASVSGDGLSEAEAQLYAYLDSMTNSKPQSGFPPLDEFNARLNEEPYRDSLLFPRADGVSTADEPTLFPFG